MQFDWIAIKIIERIGETVSVQAKEDKDKYLIFGSHKLYSNKGAISTFA